jgi:hypothetical protein
MDCQEKVTPKILPARILVTGSVAAIENEISCFILDLRLAFLEDTMSEYLSVHVFLNANKSHTEKDTSNKPCPIYMTSSLLKAEFLTSMKIESPFFWNPSCVCNEKKVWHPPFLLSSASELITPS